MHADELSIESTGFVEGAVWVLRLVNVQDWPVAITAPTPTTARQTRSAAIAGGAAPDPFTNSALKAEYKGYKRWRVSTRPHTHTPTGQRPAPLI